MINILVVTHGEFAKGILGSINMILGDQEDLNYLQFNPQDSLDSLVSNLKESINDFNNDNECLLFVDLFGGSPSNAVAMLLSEGYKIEAISGVNLPMILEAVVSRDIYTIKELVKHLTEVGKEGIIDIAGTLLEE